MQVLAKERLSGLCGAVVPLTAGQEPKPELSMDLGPHLTRRLCPGKSRRGLVSRESIGRGKTNQVRLPRRGRRRRAPPHPELITARLEPHHWRWKREVTISSYSKKLSHSELPETQMNVGDMPTASWIKKMSSNWILPFFI